MKKSLSILVLSITSLSFAQVGINAKSPKATLDIKPKTTDGTQAEGLLVPHLTADEVKTMTEKENVIGVEQEGLTVYITDPFTQTTDQQDKYVLIDGKGYYYWDNSVTQWKKLQDTKPTGLERITEGENAGWRLIGVNPANYGNIGKNAVDLSTSEENSDTAGAIGKYSVAMGYQTEATNHGDFAVGTGSKASGINSVAMGNSAQALGVNSTAIGARVIAKGERSVAFGSEVLSDGNYAVGMGLGTNAKGDYSFATGLDTEALGENSIAMGRNAEARAPFSVAIGEKAIAYAPHSFVLGPNRTGGDYSLATGYGSIAKSDFTIAMGYRPVATGFASIAIGHLVSAESASSIAMGYLTTEENNPETKTYNKRYARLFTLGNAWGSENPFVSTPPSDAFTVLRNAKMGIDIDNFETTKSDAKLQVNGTIKISNNGITNENGVYDDSEMPCNANNAGSIRYKETENKGYFEGCRKNAETYEWIKLNN